jgi:hypothetical protein
MPSADPGLSSRSRLTTTNRSASFVSASDTTAVRFAYQQEQEGTGDALHISLQQGREPETPGSTVKAQYPRTFGCYAHIDDASALQELSSKLR